MFIPNSVLASKSQRFLNFVIDRIFFLIIMMLLGLLLGLIAELTEDYSWVEWLDNVAPLVDFLISNLIFLLYYFVFELAFERTIGKFITGTKVISKNQNELQTSQIAYRTLSRIIPFEPLSFFGDVPIGWHDSNGDSLVVDVKKYNSEIQLRKSFEEIGNVID
jgi:uncharacterized RDD family membrane protein YckC